MHADRIEAQLDVMQALPEADRDRRETIPLFIFSYVTYFHIVEEIRLVPPTPYIIWN